MPDIVLRLELPPPELSPNDRTDWHVKAKLKAAYRYAAQVEARNLRIVLELTRPLRPPVDADIVFVLRDRRRRDADNLVAAIKGGIDGLVDAHLLEDDSLGKLRLRPDWRLCRFGEKPHVEISLTAYDFGGIQA